MTRASSAQRKTLTARTVASIKPPAAGQKEYFDAALPGFGVRVSVKGTKSFVLFYRPKAGPDRGKLKRVTIGTTAGYTLAEAREKARLMKQAVEAGDDPKQLLEEKHTAALRRAKNTIGSLVDQFIEKYAKRQTRSWEQARGVFDRHVLPTWRDRPIDSINRRDVIELLDGLVEKNMPVMANRTLAHIRKFLNWCVERSIIEANPAALVKPPGGKEEPRERELGDEEIKALWPVFGSLGYPFGPMFQLMLVTGQRRSEVANMRWDDIDIDAAVWTLPKEATKGRRTHTIPLSALALDILNGVPRQTGPYVFSTTGGKKPVSGYSKTKQRAERLIATRREADGLDPLPNWTLHDLRRTAATGMAKLGIPIDHIGRVLNHAPRGVTASVYDKHTYQPEKKRALDAWARKIESLIRETPDNVVTLEAQR